MAFHQEPTVTRPLIPRVAGTSCCSLPASKPSSFNGNRGLRLVNVRPCVFVLFCCCFFVLHRVARNRRNVEQTAGSIDHGRIIAVLRDGHHPYSTSVTATRVPSNRAKLRCPIVPGYHYYHYTLSLSADRSVWHSYS